MDKHDSDKNKSDRSVPPEDESHIIRSDNSIDSNKQLYTQLKNAESAEHNEKKSINNDPASFPGGKTKNEPKVFGRKRVGINNN